MVPAFRWQIVVVVHTVSLGEEQFFAGFTTITSTAILFGKTTLNTTLRPHLHRRSDTHGWHPRVPRLATPAKKIRVDEPQGHRDPRHYGFDDPRERLSWVSSSLSEQDDKVRRAHEAGRGVCSRCLLC